MADQRANFESWAKDKGYDTAYTYDTERSRHVWLNPMTADLWPAWLSAYEQGLTDAEKACRREIATVSMFVTSRECIAYNSAVADCAAAIRGLSKEGRGG